MPELTKRQLEVLLMICEGLSSNQIGDRLGIGRKTVEFHRHELYKRLQLSGIAGLVRYAIRNKIIEA